MRCLIKNIPPSTFRIAGNRGVGFPLAVFCSEPILDDGCYLAKEEDGITDIFTENENQIGATCTNIQPEEFCYIVLQENTNTWLGQQENAAEVILISCDEDAEYLCQLALQEDRTVCIAQQDGDCLMVEDCPEDCYLVDAADPNIWVVDHDGSYIFTNCS